MPAQLARRRVGGQRAMADRRVEPDEPERLVQVVDRPRTAPGASLRRRAFQWRISQSMPKADSPRAPTVAIGVVGQLLGELADPVAGPLLPDPGGSGGGRLQGGGLGADAAIEPDGGGGGAGGQGALDVGGGLEFLGPEGDFLLDGGLVLVRDEGLAAEAMLEGVPADAFPWPRGTGGLGDGGRGWRWSWGRPRSSGVESVREAVGADRAHHPDSLEPSTGRLLPSFVEFRGREAEAIGPAEELPCAPGWLPPSAGGRGMFAASRRSRPIPGIRCNAARNTR